MKRELVIQNNCGFCKDCFNLRRDSSAYCGKCKEERKKIYIDEQRNFPLFNKVKKIFSITDNTIFSYGDTIYTNNDLDYGLQVHEITHTFQQEKIGKDEWWKKYLRDKKFRLDQETEAYHNQYECYKRNDLKKSEIMLNLMAKDLSSKLYGNIISLKEAVDVIQEYVN